MSVMLYNIFLTFATVICHQHIIMTLFLDFDGKLRLAHVILHATGVVAAFVCETHAPVQPGDLKPNRIDGIAGMECL